MAALEWPRRRHLRGDGLWAAAVWGGHGADQRRDVAGRAVGMAGGWRWDGMTPLECNLLGWMSEFVRKNE